MSNLATREHFRSAYFPANDFCALFERDMHLLYSLALLLTGEHRIAEQCFQLALKQCLEGQDVFRGFERSWSRRAIVKQAIQLVRPQAGDSDALAALRTHRVDSPAGLLQLQPFDRFVFAMTVLERYTMRETAALLNTVPSQVEKARIRVFEAMAPEQQAGATGQLGWTRCNEADVSATA